MIESDSQRNALSQVRHALRMKCLLQPLGVARSILSEFGCQTFSPTLHRIKHEGQARPELHVWMDEVLGFIAHVHVPDFTMVPKKGSALTPTKRLKRAKFALERLEQVVG